MNPLWQQYQLAKSEHPKKYARDLAALMGVSEAELCHARVGHEAQPLKPQFRELMLALEAVGETKNITRNAYAVHEHLGHYQNVRLGDHAGLVLNPRALDLRFFPDQWRSAFFLREQSARGERQSIQIFDRYGDAVLKIYATDHTDMNAWQVLIARFVDNAPAALRVEAVEAANFACDFDAAALDSEWRAMTDVHQFFRLLKRHNVSRLQAFRAAGDDLAWRVDNNSLARLLTQVQEEGNEIMIFVGNRGCTQIFTGALEKLVPTGNWLNVFNSNFTLHLMADRIHESWVTRKPSGDGFVTSLELFAADGTQIAQLYGQRSEGTSEQTRWREQVTSLSAAGEAA